MTGRNRRFKAGFTLIELIVVITIIGILATFVVINAPKFIYDANLAKVESDIKAIEGACDLFKIQNFRYPESLDELVNPPEDRRGNKREAYIAEVPMDPWQRDYIYSLEDRKPIILCVGEDGQEGTQDDISNEKESDRM